MSPPETGGTGHAAAAFVSRRAEIFGWSFVDCGRSVAPPRRMLSARCSADRLCGSARARMQTVGCARCTAMRMRDAQTHTPTGAEGQ
eukprot:2706411-Rhodomonas_salina.2